MASSGDILVKIDRVLRDILSVEELDERWEDEWNRGFMQGESRLADRIREIMREAA